MFARHAFAKALGVTFIDQRLVGLDHRRIDPGDVGGNRLGGGEQLFHGWAERVARISPAREDSPAERGLVLFGTGFDPLAPSALRILAMRSLGTAVEVYEIP
mgnify:CR=1 FL=1